jgi:hypothetical protein
MEEDGVKKLFDSVAPFISKAVKIRVYLVKKAHLLQ